MLGGASSQELIRNNLQTVGNVGWMLQIQVEKTDPYILYQFAV